MPLSDYKDLVGTLASYAAIAQMFSGVFMCRDIARAGTTRGTPSTMFVMGSALGVLMFEFARIMNDDAMLRANWAGLLLNAAYLSCYWYYCDDRPSLYKSVSKAATITGVLLVYVRLEDPALVEHRFGMIVTVIIFFLIASPLFSIGEIIRTKSSASLPAPMIISGTVVTALWLLYGVIIESTFMQYQNAVFLLLSLVQVALIVIYPRTPPSLEAKKDD